MNSLKIHIISVAIFIVHGGLMASCVMCAIGCVFVWQDGGSLDGIGFAKNLWLAISTGLIIYWSIQEMVRYMISLKENTE